jgi:hypothetical protein
MVVLAGCGGSGHHGYPSNLVTDYLNACEADETAAGLTGRAAVERCGCRLDWVQANVPLSKFESGEETVKSGGTTPDWIFEAIGACAAQF